MDLRHPHYAGQRGDEQNLRYTSPRARTSPCAESEMISLAGFTRGCVLGPVKIVSQLAFGRECERSFEVAEIERQESRVRAQDGTGWYNESFVGRNAVRDVANTRSQGGVDARYLFHAGANVWRLVDVIKIWTSTRTYGTVA